MFSENGVDDLGVQVFRVDQEAVHVKETGSDGREAIAASATAWTGARLSYLWVSAMVALFKSQGAFRLGMEA